MCSERAKKMATALRHVAISQPLYYMAKRDLHTRKTSNTRLASLYYSFQTTKTISDMIASFHKRCQLAVAKPTYFIKLKCVTFGRMKRTTKLWVMHRSILRGPLVYAATTCLVDGSKSLEEWTC